MTTIIESSDNLVGHQLKVAVLDAFALVFESGVNPGSFAHSLTAPAVKKALPDEKREEFMELVQKGASVKDIFGLFSLFDEFELTYLTNSFDGGYADRAFRELSNHLKDYYVI